MKTKEKRPKQEPLPEPEAPKELPKFPLVLRRPAEELPPPVAPKPRPFDARFDLSEADRKRFAKPASNELQLEHRKPNAERVEKALALFLSLPKTETRKGAHLVGLSATDLHEFARRLAAVTQPPTLRKPR